jgi:hypothetical protein
MTTDIFGIVGSWFLLATASPADEAAKPHQLQTGMPAFRTSGNGLDNSLPQLDF